MTPSHQTIWDGGQSAISQCKDSTVKDVIRPLAGATTGKSITSFGVGIKRRATGANPAEGGAAVGGKHVSFPDSELFTRDLATQIGSDERAP